MPILGRRQAGGALGSMHDLHVLTGGCAPLVASMHAVRDRAIGMQTVHAIDKAGVAEGHSMQILHTRQHRGAGERDGLCQVWA
jgi:hypothetical protein